MKYLLNIYCLVFIFKINIILCLQLNDFRILSNLPAVSNF